MELVERDGGGEGGGDIYMIERRMGIVHIMRDIIRDIMRDPIGSCRDAP